MATALFSAIATTAKLEAFASFGLAVLGSYLDALIVQALTAPDDIEGQKVDEFKTTQSEYGVPIPLCYGASNRVPGNIIWTSGITETSQTRREGDNALSSGTKITEYTYYGSFAVAISGRPVSRVTRIWANNKVVFESELADGSVPTVTLYKRYSSLLQYLNPIYQMFPGGKAEIEAFVDALLVDPPPTYINEDNGGVTYVNRWIPDEIRDPIRAISDEWAAIWDRLEAGEKVPVTDFPEDAIAGATYYGSFSSEFYDDEQREHYHTLGTNFGLLWITSSHTSVSDEIVVYKGTQTQGVDPTMEASEGVGNVPAYRGVAYVVFKNINLSSEFRNSVPNFQFEVEADTSIGVSTLVSDLCSRAGVTDASTINLGLAEVNGMVVHKNAPLASLLPMLEAKYRFHSIQQNGDIRFIPRPSGMVGTLSLDDLGGYEAGGSRPENGPIEYSIIPNYESPRQISVRYIDIGREYQTNTQHAFRPVNQGNNDYVVDIPISMTADESRTVAEQIGRDMWSRKWQVRFSTSDKFVGLMAGQSVGIPFNDEIKPILVTNVTRGRNGLIEIQGEFEDVALGSISVTGESANYTANRTIIGAYNILVVLDGPLIHSGGDDNDGVYWAATGTTADWTGCDILYNTGYDSTFVEIGETNTPATIGDVATALPSGPSVTWDRTNSVTVDLYSPATSLDSREELDVLNGANLAWLGAQDGSRGEIIQFADATYVSDTTYTISTLLRGLYGTEHEIDNHGDDEVFVLLDPTSVGSAAFGRTDWNEIYAYFASTEYNSNIDTFGFTMVNTGIRSKPLSPVHVQGVRDASNNLTVTWQRRIRGTINGLGGAEEPLNEESEAYEVDITGPGGVVLRTVSATSETITYTGTDQFNDGLTPGDPVDLRVYQISATKGRGYPAMATV